MADFSTPFGDSSEKRLPTNDEKQNGMPCGPAHQRLFNGLFHRLESEVGEVISHAGLTPDDDDLTQLRQAIESLIAAATGSGDTSQFILISQARARLPIYPEFLTVDGRINVISPAVGTVRLPSGIQFMHRGIFPVTTEQTDFQTDVSKTYHLRWSSTNGYQLKDLSDTAYNLNSLSETDEVFDSTYDDMLISRIITNSSNVATITNLANKHQLKTKGYGASAPYGTAGYGGLSNSTDIENNVMDPELITRFQSVDLNWARKPNVYITALNDVHTEIADSVEFSMGAKALSRYQIGVWAQGDDGHATGWGAIL